MSMKSLLTMLRQSTKIVSVILTSAQVEREEDLFLTCFLSVGHVITDCLSDRSSLIHHMSVLSDVLLFIRLSVPMHWSDVGVQHIILVQTQVDAGIVQRLLLILVLIQFQGWQNRLGLDLSGQTKKQIKFKILTTPLPSLMFLCY